MELLMGLHQFRGENSALISFDLDIILLLTWPGNPPASGAAPSQCSFPPSSSTLVPSSSWDQQHVLNMQPHSTGACLSFFPIATSWVPVLSPAFPAKLASAHTSREAFHVADRQSHKLGPTGSPGDLTPTSLRWSLKPCSEEWSFHWILKVDTGTEVMHMAKSKSTPGVPGLQPWPF